MNRDASHTMPEFDSKLAIQIKQWGKELGFQNIGIADTDLSLYEPRLQAWLEKNYHGDMDYMARYGTRRSRPEALIPGTKTAIVGIMHYLTPSALDPTLLKKSEKAYISRYALGRDYHKLIRKRLKALAEKIKTVTGDFEYRPFADSAPVLEKPLAEKAGLGWIGKNTLLLNRQSGSWFFLGVLYTNLNLPLDQPVKNHCGSCRACLARCPTDAIVGPYQLDARKCISNLTIENRGSIPEDLRPLIGNRIYGCDDCQIICPWNRFAKPTDEDDFKPRHGLSDSELVDLFNWSEETFLKKTAGSAIRRIGYEAWLRNIAVALGNAQPTPEIIQALSNRLDYPSDLVQEHIKWALARLKTPRDNSASPQ